MHDLDKIRFSSVSDVYDGIEVDENVIRKDEKGCFDPGLWNVLLKDDKRETISVLELGTWYGYGAVNLSKKLQVENKKFRIVCVDTWLGSPEHLYDSFNPSSKLNIIRELKLKNGYPNFYTEFLKVVKYYNEQDNIIPFPNTTIAFFNTARMLGLKFDYIVIDASHQYEDVIIDLQIAWELLNPKGIIVGDDLSWPGVSKAIREFADREKLRVQSTHNQYILQKS